ncbi:hypothetical protein CYY_009258 [Polysphondylium violaceum]|uniref:Uncharacterized protein n=1 Tax=Polysphondylium violaceum TaxID=133409 RepID=A0A8J4PM02_9MYCE|nr:hypothetical protein CYY_009258 [Polysphondylium violaceum]
MNNEETEAVKKAINLKYARTYTLNEKVGRFFYWVKNETGGYFNTPGETKFLYAFSTFLVSVYLYFLLK